MGGVQSGAHNLGDALWMHERQRQRGQREIPRYEPQSEQNSQGRRKLLKRTRSLAVISEDSRNDREVNRNFSVGELTLDVPRRPQLIPRAKLIDRNSLKDRLSKSQQHLSDTYDGYHEVRPYHSHSICDLHSRPSTLPYLQEPPYCARLTNREEPDRLNILDWPRTPRRYRSHQDLDTVSGLVDIVEDDWPALNEGQRDIYTQVKRKRKEHRSLDSILFEDGEDGELEYFDVLNLLPLSKVRLEFDESDTRNSNFTPSNRVKLVGGGGTKGNETSSESDGESINGVESEPRQTPRILQVSEFSDDNQDNSLQIGSNVTDEEKYRSHSVDEKIFEKSPTDEESWKSFLSSSGRSVWETNSHRESFDTAKDEVEQQSKSLERKNIEDECNNNLFGKQPVDTRISSEKNHSESEEKNTSTSVIVDGNEGNIPGGTVEEAEDSKSLWISDSEEIEDMSRRPQVLKIIDSEVTKKRNWGPTVIEIDDVARQETNVKRNNHHMEQDIVDENVKQKNGNDKQECKIGEACNLFKSKFTEKEVSKPESRFDKIVKETSSMIGKACRSLRFEAPSESSDLGLGSDCGSDTRRRSIDDDDDDDDDDDEDDDDDGVDVTEDIVPFSKKPSEEQLSMQMEDKNNKAGSKICTNLTRSRSCVKSLECQDTDAAEFDHVRYKIVKSRLFGKNIYGNVPHKGDVGYEGLMQYLRDYSFQELLLDNNVVIIEPVRAEHIEIKSSSTVGKGKTNTSEKKSENESGNNSETTAKNKDSQNISKQSSLRKHFFYHPIRVNRELIDEELPDPDTVRNVRRIFEATLFPKSTSNQANCKGRKSVSMKDLSNMCDDVNVNNLEISRSRSSSRAKDLMRLFEGLDRTSSTTIQTGKDALGNVTRSNESKTRIIAQSFEATSGDTSASDVPGCARNKIKNYREQINRRHHLTNWDAGSVSSGVSSDYPDTDPGSGAQCTCSEDEDIDCRDDEAMRNNTEREDGHYVSILPDVLKKIRECGTSVTYYGGKVVNTCNGPLISPTSCKSKILKRNKPSLRLDDYVKFRLVKSNSCDSRLELTGRVVERRSRLEAKQQRENNNSSTGKLIRNSDLTGCTIAESPSIEITTPNSLPFEDDRVEIISKSITKREPPVVIGLEPKKDDNRNNGGFFKANFQLGQIHDGKSNIANKFASALTKWQINECDWKKNQTDFGKMEFEEFEVLEDSLNGTDN
ncbi:uncharacterized protein LOC107043256 isoform X2 [Diachasma alloeum]|uniref:uncharacterized protein LOC107043256 isoform X2 n=1 Tax=Diachasma alloeum TaxID=454923 RepID=UPI00073811ED|nr:uncharacterized protein LOC107043256 isoform X2 [Diachasma alloeum]